MRVAITLLALLVILSGYFINESFAEISENQAFLLEGSGFAVTEKLIRTSEIDLGLSSQQQRGSTINFQTEDGFITLDDEEFTISNLEGKFLREGRFIRVSGNIESSSGFDTSISLFGRLVEDSKDGAIYSFTGRIMRGDDSYKTIYTTKLSSLSNVIQNNNPSNLKTNNELTIHILPGSSTKEIASNYIEAGKLIQDQIKSQSGTHLGYYSQDRIRIEPGTTLTFVNDDSVPHSISSGTGLGQNARATEGKTNICDETQLEKFKTVPGHGSSGFSFKSNDCTFTLDGRIKSGKILPGESWSVTIEKPGFYRMADVDYIWMNMVVYAFPDTQNGVIRQATGPNQFAN